MQLAMAVLALATGSAPGAGLTAAFTSGLQLTLQQDENGPPPGSPYPPPPPLVETPPLPKQAPTEQPPPSSVEPPPRATAFPPPPVPQIPRAFLPPESTPKEPGSVPVAYWEAFGADFGLRLVFESVVVLSFVLAVEELESSSSNTAAGAFLFIPGIAALIGQPFAMAGIVGAIFHGERLHPRYWASFWGDVVGTLLVGPAAGLLFGFLANAATNQNGLNATAAIVVGISTFAIAGAFGAPSGADFSLPAQPQPSASAARVQFGIPLVKLAFN